MSRSGKKVKLKNNLLGMATAIATMTCVAVSAGSSNVMVQEDDHSGSYIDENQSRQFQHINDGFESFDENDFRLQKSHEFRRHLQDEEGGALTTDETSTKDFVRAEVRSVTNGGKLSLQFDREVEFPGDFIDQLNANKDKFIVLQVAAEGQKIEPIPPVLPVYPITKETYVEEYNLVTSKIITIEEANENSYYRRANFYKIVDWEALSYSSRMLTIRMLFDDVEIISATEDQTDIVYITLNLSDFKTSDGLFMPDRSLYSTNLPAQMEPEKAEKYETIGEVSSYIFLGLLLINGVTNSVFSDLDYQTLFDAIEGPQLNSFLAGMNVKMPADANLMMAQIKDSASLEPSDVLSQDGGPSIAENIFGEIPFTGPLNDRLATLGYDDMAPIAELQTVSIELCTALSGLFFALLFYSCTRFRGSMLAKLWANNIGDFILWGTIINLVMINYLPVIMATFISSIGMQWNDINNAVLLTNLWTILMLSIWITCPVLMILIFLRNRANIGKLHKAEVKGASMLDRDPMRLSWKKDWSQGTIASRHDDESQPKEANALTIPVKTQKKINQDPSQRSSFEDSGPEQAKSEWKNSVHETTIRGKTHPDTVTNYNQVEWLKEQFDDDTLPQIRSVDLYEGGDLCFGFQFHYQNDVVGQKFIGSHAPKNIVCTNHALEQDEFITKVDVRTGSWVNRVSLKTNKGRELSAGGKGQGSYSFNLKENADQPQLLALGAGMGGHIHHLKCFYVNRDAPEEGSKKNNKIGILNKPKKSNKVNPQGTPKPLALNQQSVVEQQYEGGETDNDQYVYRGELPRSMSRRSSSLEKQSEPEAPIESKTGLNDRKMGTKKKNTWQIFGKNLPRWLNPRSKNKVKVNAKGKESVKYMDRMKDKLPTNQGVAKNAKTKEHPHAGPFDRNFGEFYKKMDLNEKKTTSETALFLGFFGMWRKLTLAVSLVFFQDNFRLQSSTQMVSSGIMTGYLMSQWPCARYIDNVSKVMNELTYMSLIACQIYIKEMKSQVNEFSLGQTDNLSAMGNLMIALIGINLLFHCGRMIHNTFLAFGTIKMRRQQILTKMCGPPTVYSEPSDPDNQDSSGPEPDFNPEKNKKQPFDMPELPQPPANYPDKPDHPSDPDVLVMVELVAHIKANPFFVDKLPVLPGDDKDEKQPPPEPQEEMCINWHIIELDAKMPALGRVDPIEQIEQMRELSKQIMVDVKPIIPDGRKIEDFDLPMVEIPEVTGKEPIFVGLYSSKLPPKFIKDKMPQMLDGTPIPEPEMTSIESPPASPRNFTKLCPKCNHSFTDEELEGHIIGCGRKPEPRPMPQAQRKLIAGKIPKPLKPKPFQKVPNTIPMPLKMIAIPFKPVGEPRGRNPKSPAQTSPVRKPSPQKPKNDEFDLQNSIPVRMPEKNQIALQQLTLADSQRYDRVILGDVDRNTQSLLNALRNEGRIEDFSMVGTAMDPQAEVILNGGLTNMTKFLKLQKKQDENQSLSRVTNQLLHEQLARQNYKTVQGMENFNDSSPQRSPNRFHNVGNGLNASKTDMVFDEEDAKSQNSPRVDLEPILQSNHDRKELDIQQQLFDKMASPGLTIQTPTRPQTNNNANHSPLNKQLQEMSNEQRGRRPIATRQGGQSPRN